MSSFIDERNVKVVFTDGALVEASGTVTLASSIADNTVTVNGLVYTAVSGAKASNAQFSIDTDDATAAADLADSITNDTREGTDPTVELTATSDGAVVTITASPAGTIGNAITLASSDGATLAVSGATLAGGTGSIGGAFMTPTAYKAAIQLAQKIEAQHAQSAVADKAGVNVYLAGNTPNKVIKFTLTTEMQNAYYEFVFVEEVDSFDNLS